MSGSCVSIMGSALDHWIWIQGYARYTDSKRVADLIGVVRFRLDGREPAIPLCRVHFAKEHSQIHQNNPQFVLVFTEFL
jgi:hypothetical protein